MELSVKRSKVSTLPTTKVAGIPGLPRTLMRLSATLASLQSLLVAAQVGTAKLPPAA